MDLCDVLRVALLCINSDVQVAVTTLVTAFVVSEHVWGHRVAIVKTRGYASLDGLSAWT